MPEMVMKLHSLAFMDGMPLTAHWLVAAVTTAEESQ
jgi:hypothetical protein